VYITKIPIQINENWFSLFPCLDPNLNQTILFYFIILLFLLSHVLSVLIALQTCSFVCNIKGSDDDILDNADLHQHLTNT
jgi:hypothetical protein